MNPAAAIARFVKLLPARLGRVRGRAPRRLPSTRPPRNAGRRTLACFVVAVLGLHAAAFVAMDVAAPRLRDPEYGIRVNSLRERMAEFPDRPVVLAVGSSRMSMGVRPGAWEAVRPDEAGTPGPLIFNQSLVGSGPVIELMNLRRVYADGFRPDAVVLEYWPPFLREDGAFFEPDRVDHTRLYRTDLPTVREFFHKSDGSLTPEIIERKMLRDRLYPLVENRQRLMAQIAPRWLPWDKRMEMAWANLDGWGWLSGLEEHYPPDPEMRAKRLQHCEKIYRGQFQGYTISPLADRALRETVALARQNGARVALAYLPEATEFRGWMPPEVERMAQAHLAGLRRELDIPLIDTRLWMEDGYLVDGFHLSRVGAAEFTKRFGPAVAATFPDLRRER